MKIRTVVATAVLGAGVITASTGIVHADPALATTSAVNYTAAQHGDSAVITTDAGSIAVDRDTLVVKAADGQLLASLPLSFHLDDKIFPIAAVVDGRTATLTPILDPARATPAAPIATMREVTARTRDERDKEAFTKMDGQVRFSVMMGAIVGGVLAAGVGCVIGGVVAAPSAVLTAIFGPLAGCVAGALVTAPIGAIGGTLFIAAPVALASAVQYFTAITAPMPAASPETR
ncbi:hypothetical protein GFY24_10570 [Nocardia sp. SYP-A9097]|uniref:hypothetical protein n=1 Tax=Nocardia sp. SYP-A9097 TaxID=2663237 RepID=UPI00129AC646|nr:hypothetical protein [Nocardia sp. SYP-A9097]MRH87887.1 hypothetical protein [Nocardia sp. SYP-A9097]